MVPRFIPDGFLAGLPHHPHPSPDLSYPASPSTSITNPIMGNLVFCQERG